MACPEDIKIETEQSVGYRASKKKLRLEVSIYETPIYSCTESTELERDT